MSSMPRILIVGNCQSKIIANCMQVMLPAYDVQVATAGKGPKDKDKPIDYTCDVIFYHGKSLDAIDTLDATRNTRKIRIPRVIFQGYHPDMTGIVHDGGRVANPLGAFTHSALAFYAFSKGYSATEAEALFNAGTFRKLGYFDIWDGARRQLFEEARQCGIDIAPLFQDWTRQGAFMHTFNHPALRVIASLCKVVLEQNGFTPHVNNPADFLQDPLMHGRWGVYPELAEVLRCPGEYTFMPRQRGNLNVLHLPDFIRGSFEIYRTYPANALRSSIIDIQHFDNLLAGPASAPFPAPGPAPEPATTRPPEQTAQTAQTAPQHPYATLPAHHFWRKAVAAVHPRDLDPMVGAPFTLSESDRVATAGSCFAQHIARRLQQQGYNYFVTEQAPSGMSADEQAERGYGLFSARYGNLYTARQLLQLFDRAYGTFTPAEAPWQRPDGRFVDPFRPQLEPAGFASPEDVIAERERHFSDVRRMFEQLNIFVFTLGLTEGWQSLEDGAVFPIAPGVVAGAIDPTRHGFVNFTTRQVVDDLGAFLDRLASVNPAARTIFTVSPVPLVATYENRHVLTSTMASKAILRAAADEICQHESRPTYFPSFEIITGHYNKGSYFAEDLRSVTPDGVSHVMDTFFRHFTDHTAAQETELAPLFDVICDEEKLDV